MELDPHDPAVRHNDGLDCVPTDKYVLFRHHFAAIAGAGPLVGPVLAAQMGYLPGMLDSGRRGVRWRGAGFHGPVHLHPPRRPLPRRSGQIELGPVPGVIALFGTFMIMVIILAVLALIVVKALAESPWGMFTVAATIPIALFMGVYTATSAPAASAKCRSSASCC
jgi:carbon starvation protein